MNFCAAFQRQLHNAHPDWTWRVAENPDPSTSVIILSQGQQIPGEVFVSVHDRDGAKLAEVVVGGQAYCNALAAGRSELDFARETGAKILKDAALE
jgi:hypothetical protein